MAKFKVGDRVRVISNNMNHGFCVGHEGVLTEVRESDFDGQRLKMGRMWVSGDVEPATPTEHPALTLAKAEVVRLTAMPQNQRWSADEALLEAYGRILAAFGLRYAIKPVAPQPVEYDFFPTNPEQGA